MRKAQGALEYLIIIAAVLAIAAIVVLFLTGAFKSPLNSAQYTACKNAASACAMKKSTGSAGTSACVADCITACRTTAGKDVVAGVAPAVWDSTTCKYDGTLGTAIGCSYCANGTTGGW